MFLLRTQSFKNGLLLNSISLGILITVYTTICCNSIPTTWSTKDTLKSEKNEYYVQKAEQRGLFYVVKLNGT